MTLTHHLVLYCRLLPLVVVCCRFDCNLSKEPCILSKEPCILSKEPCILSQASKCRSSSCRLLLLVSTYATLYVDTRRSGPPFSQTKETCILSKEPCILSKEPCILFRAEECRHTPRCMSTRGGVVLHSLKVKRPAFSQTKEPCILSN